MRETGIEKAIEICATNITNKGVSERFERIGNRYIRMIFRSKHTLRCSLMKTRPERDPLQTAHLHLQYSL
jgi:hypothetical protein